MDDARGRAAVPEAVARYRPVVYLHRAEGYLPSDPARFLKDAFLGWSISGREEDVETVADPVDAATLLSAEHRWKGRTHRGRDFTRPYGERAWRAVDLLGQDGVGFCLARRNEPSSLDGTGNFDGAPVLYEYVERAYVTYWFFYDWSTLPLLGSLSPDRLETRGVPELDPEVELKNEVPVELWEAFPGLVETYADEEAATRGAVGTRGFGDSFEAMKRFFQRLRERRPKRFPVAHEADWERISVRLDADEKMVQAAYYQHNGAPELLGPAGLGERPVVYVAKGSHASYPNDDLGHGRRKLVKAAEVFGDGIHWDVAEDQLVDATKAPWYGFGGAWGRPGPDSNQTGPLGPSPYKPPAPFRAPLA